MTAYTKSAIHRLAEASRDFEIWWDSSPLVFQFWSEKMLEKADPEERDKLEKQLKVLFDYENPADTLFCGVTTNPRLISKVIGLFPEQIKPVIDKLITEYPLKTNGEIAWELYKDITVRGAQKYMPLFEKSNYKKGYVSAQVDPRLSSDIEGMLLQALELKKIASNIMIKSPGSKEGIYLIQILTSIGIPTNSTLIFNVPGVLQAARAVKRGYEIGRQWGIDFSRWRSVITIMVGRFEERPQFAESASSVGIELNEEIKRWAGIAVAKKAYELLNNDANCYPSKLLLCSSRLGPGEGNVRHIEKTAGGNLIFALNPGIIDDFMKICDSKDIYSQIKEPVPAEIMDKLLAIPYFQESYNEDGITVEDFDRHPSFIHTKEEFSGSMEEIEAYVDKKRKQL